MFLPVGFANQRRERGVVGREGEMSGQSEQRVALLQDYGGLSSPCFQQTEAKGEKKKRGVLMDGWMMKMKMMAKRFVPGDREEQRHPSRGPQSAQTSEQSGRLFRRSR